MRKITVTFLIALLALTPLIAGQAQQTTQVPPRPATSTQGPATSQAPRPYVVGPGDSLQIEFLGIPDGDKDMNRTYLVQANGTIENKYLESIKVEGLTALQVGELLASTLEKAGLYNPGQLRPSVRVTEFRTQEVNVQGAVRAPGMVKVPGNAMTVNRAISLAGGFATNAGTEVDVIRTAADGTTTVTVVTREQLDMNDDPGLVDGDRVNVKIGKVFYVNGEVNAAGEKPWSPGMTVNKALNLAGGANAKFSLKRSRIERPEKQKDGTIKYRKIGSLKLETLILPEDIFVAGRGWM